MSRLMEKIGDNSNIDKEFIEKVYQFACKAHLNQKRVSGEDYIIHPVEVAIILIDMGMDTNTVAAGLLHDVIEDTKYSYDDLKENFNEEVANLVDGVTKLGEIEYKSREEQQADNVRKMLLAMAKDARVILIKLADRLHNLRTLKYLPEDKQKRIAKETMDIYAPLAHRLGISKVKWELEDLSFRYLNPEEYYDLANKISVKRAEREKYLNSIMSEIKDNLLQSGIESDIDGRPKHLYSIYRKMVNKSKSLDQIFDMIAIRILVDNVKDCYAALGICHTIYKPMPGRFKDYIAMPKPNMYQSLHSTVIGPKGQPFEIQIRTFEMHKTAEYGIAAHWKYKEGISPTTNNKLDLKLSWLREILEWQGETNDPSEFIEAFKIDLFSDEIFVFTPKGTVISLPSNSTPIDFAYKIHTDVGNRCTGAKVNGKIVPLDYHLKTGEIVEIITSAGAKGPSIDWLNIASSNNAKSKIRAWFKKIKREEYIDKGKDAFEKEAKKQGYNFGELIKGDNLDIILKRFHFYSIDDLYAAAGIGSIVPSNIILKLRENVKEIKTNEDAIKEIEKNIEKETNKNVIKSNKIGVVVKGVDNILVRFAKCCNPVPGDAIVGYITKGRGVSIHRKDCKNAALLSEDIDNKMVEVSWGKSENAYYTAEIQIKAEDRDRLLSDIMELITESKIHLNAVSAKAKKNNIAYVDIQLRINSIEKLNDLIKAFRKIKGVLEVYRTKS
ncbi:MAG: bifunctional (p)ppGpp synthetase/guanosine-3',5'-bis(diphosphate) 3'-pyrophosphohydrolase [Bacillota bacterium]|nr:bifunctional (p)ppGpp synthetase/guanosine-3',5'-bis(diphosphate) 3'-pyrophosphohydrolase [Bacillota bacterium]